MDTTLLAYFLTVAKRQHMTKAAEELHITQPSLSTAIRRLENEVGVPLFDRVGRNIQLNEYGLIFQTGASAALQALDSSLEEIRQRKDSAVSFVRLACSRSPVNLGLIERLIAKGVHMKIDSVPDDWDSQLLSRKLDLVITVGQSEAREIEKTPLCEQKLVIVASRSHPLAQRESVPPRELNHYPFCSTSARHALLNVARGQLLALGTAPLVSFWGETSEDMLRAIHAGKLLGVMVERNLPGDPELVVLPVEGMDVSLPIYLHWNKYASNAFYLPAIRQNIIDFYQSV